MDEILLFRYFDNLLDPDQEKEIELWIESSQENLSYAKDLYKIYVATQAQNLKNHSDSKHILDVLKSKKAAAETSQHKAAAESSQHNNKIWLWAQRVAAILFIPLAIGYLMQIFTEDPSALIEARSSLGMICTVNLPDGSKVWLNSNSRLSYPSKFTGKTRSVELDGEGYFSVNKGSKPFIVQTDGVDVEVYGTEFNVDAYADNGFISTTLVEGSVNLKYDGAMDQQLSFLMNPNQKMVYFKNGKHLVQKDTYVPNDIAWRNGNIVLRNTSFSDVLWILDKRFNVDFDVKNPEFNDYSFTGVFGGQQLEEILVHFKIASNINYDIQLPNESDDNDDTRTKITLY